MLNEGKVGRGKQFILGDRQCQTHSGYGLDLANAFAVGPIHIMALLLPTGLSGCIFRSEKVQL